MDFIDEVRTRSGRFAKRTEHLDTEEATKSALVLPFIQMLGYEIFDPTEVVPEFTADVGLKKGEKVDYALMQDGRPAVLIECKRFGSNLDDADMSQLLRYFTNTDARFGILTDGVVYRFFSDLDQPNVMDRKPFFEFNMLNFTEPQVEELKRFTKSAFSMSEVVDAARELHYTNEIKRVLTEEITEPSQEFVRLITKRVYQGSVTKTVREQFGALTHQAFTQLVNDRISVRLKSALEREEGRADPDEESPDRQEAEEPELVPAEVDALNIIKAIVRDVVDVHRIALRPAKDYCSVALHADNLRNDYGLALCRLRLRTSNLRLGLLDEEKQEERVQLDDLDSIFDYADRLRATAAGYTSEERDADTAQSDEAMSAEESS